MWDSVKGYFGFGEIEEQRATHTVEEIPFQEAVARDPKKVRIRTLGQALRGSGGGEFEAPTVDLEEISRAYHTDSYIKRAVDKYAELMFKESWEIAGKNEAASEYVWMRLKMMTEQTDMPFSQLLSEIAQDLVLFGNAYVVKQRTGKLPQGVQAQGYTSNKPVLGYFTLPPTTVQIARDENGRILQYQQDSGGGTALTFRPEDIIHFTYKKPTGRAYGIPFIFNVLDDVKILRQLEENVARLVYRNLFPLYLYKVGLDKPGFEATDEEIEEIREQIRDMPMDGGIVVPERHNISAIGSEGTALNAEPYLKYFRQRVFSGLGVSETIMGVGGTANRSTSDNQAADLFDGVKEFQRIFMDRVQHSMINELLFEGGFDPVINVDDEVLFTFNEIQLDAKIKKENHIIQMFMQNAITHEEMRQLMGLDPVADEGRLMFNMVTGSLQAQAAQQATDSAAASGSNDDKPENQHGQQDSPGDPQRESNADKPDRKAPISENVKENSQEVLTQSTGMVNLTSELTIENYLQTMKLFWDNLRDDVVQMIKNGKSEAEVKGFATELVRQSLRSRSRQYIVEAMRKGQDSATAELNKPINPQSLNFALASEKISSKSTSSIDRLINDVDKLISKAYVDDKMADKITKVVGAFNSNEYRLSFIAKTELYRAYNYGRAVTARESGLQTIGVQHTEHGCKQCVDKVNDTIELTNIDLIDAVPPHHPNCTCLVKLNMPAEEV
jgi:hypothetical protein